MIESKNMKIAAGALALAVAAASASYAAGSASGGAGANNSFSFEDDMAYLESQMSDDTADEILSDEELQALYFKELYGEVKEKASLRSVDKKALSLANDYKAAKHAPSPVLSANGAVTYTYGSTIPRILCRPLRVTDIQLQPGESVTDAPAIGDSVNWLITPASSGSGEDLTVHILVKPAMPDLVTNLIVHTDRRTYVLELVSDKKNLTPLVTFSYPEWDKRKGWENFLGEYKTQLGAAARKARYSKNSRQRASGLNENYSVTGKRYPWFPVEVIDDGTKTFITFPDNVTSNEMPVFMALRGSRKELVNYRVQGSTMIVDGVFKNSLLRVGTGAQAETVYITKKSFKAEAVMDSENPEYNDGNN